nr:hypothetical protein [Corynebacterium sp. UBA5992]
MAFEPKTDWTAGDKLTAEQMNRIEAGVAEKAAQSSLAALEARVVALETPSEG